MENNLIGKSVKRQLFNFEEFVFHLLEYVKEFGTTKVKMDNYISPDGYKLTTKVSSVRRGKINLTDQQRAKLDEIGFVWNAKKVFDFENFYSHLIDYKNKFGHLNIKISYICPDGYKLGHTINIVRSNIIKLTEKQKARLNEIGFVWNAKRVFDFENFYSRLIDYKNKFGDLNIKISYICPDGYKLGHTINIVRSNIIKLTEKQKARLNEIDFIWDARSFNFKNFYNHLLAYKNKFGNINVKISYVCPDGYKLGMGISEIRSGNIKLKDNQKAKLNQIGFVWITQKEIKRKNFDFKLFYDNLQKYKNQFGNCLVEFDYVINNYELGFYVRNIRNKRIKLTKNQIAQLNNLGFVFNTHTYYIDKPEVPLIRRMANGDISARNDIMQNYMPLVRKIAAKYKKSANYFDLVGIGYDALDKSLDNINPMQDGQVCKYLEISVTGQILSYIKECNVKSLQGCVVGYKDLTIEGCIENNAYRPDIEVENKTYTLQLLRHLKQILTKGEYKLICLHFGFNKEGINYSYEQLAQKYNTTPKKVKIAIDRIISKLKQNFSSDEWRL